MKVATTTRSVLLRFPMGEVVERAPHGRFDAFYDEGIVFLSFLGTAPRKAFRCDNSSFSPCLHIREGGSKKRRQDKTRHKRDKKNEKNLSVEPSLSLSLSLSVKFPSRSNVLFITRTRNAIKHAHARTHARTYIHCYSNERFAHFYGFLVRVGTRRYAPTVIVVVVVVVVVVERISTIHHP